MVLTKEIRLKPRERGFHIITGEVLQNLPELKNISSGLVTIFIKHTSAGITINENADPDVRVDFESWFNRNIKEREPYYVHTLEGPDDMPAHIKASLVGSSVSIPILNGSLNMGTWQGIYLCEFRNHGGARTVTVTVIGE